MSGTVQSIESDDLFPAALADAGGKLVVVDFFATWCRPCQVVAPILAQLATKYPLAVFLKVDVDKCQDTAASNGITAMPTFLFFRNKTKIDNQRGADPNMLEEKIKKWYGDGEGDEDVAVKGHMDLSSFIAKTGSECLNGSDEHTLEHALTSKGGYLESDCDEQLIISVAFSQAIKLHSLKMHGPKDKGPKNVKLFLNQPRTMDFDQVEGMEPVQALTLEAADLEEGALIPLKFVKFQNVQNITLFVRDNQAGEETTQIDFLAFIGSPVSTTNMAEFKRVSGKKGESHF